MTVHIEHLKLFYKQLSNLELVKLRHDAIRLEDNETKRLIDEELKARVKK